MLKRSWLLLTGLLVAATPARAVTLTLVGPAGPSLVGEIVEIDVLVSPPGLGDFAAPSLRSFDLDVGYDPTHLGFAGVVFDVFLGMPDVQALTDAGAAGGVVDLAAVSLLSTTTLHALQPSDFRLATLSFVALVEETSALAFSQTVLGDTSGAALSVDAALGAEVTSLEVIPEPGTAGLLALGVLGLAGLGRRARRDAGARGR